MRRILGLMLPAVLVAATLFALGGAPALASHVQCGDVIRQDTKLDSDLTDCAGDGLAIGAGDITLDLGGHLIDGLSGGAGIHNPGWDGVVIRNGAIREFSDGIFLDHGGSRNEVHGVAISATSTGIYLSAAESLVKDSSVSGPGTGIDVYGADSRVIGNNIDGNGTGIRSHAVSEQFSDISHNVIVNSAGTGILLVDSDRNRLSENLIVNNGTRQPLPHGEGIQMFHTYNTVVEKNVVAGNGVGIKMALYSHGNRLRKNHISSNDGDGIWVFEGTHDNLIDHNVASRNGDDGIDFDFDGVDTSIELRHNRVDWNGDLGIEAEGDVIDGGGNRAFGNGNPLQCLNVRCK